jgi:hypothetical protein
MDTIGLPLNDSYSGSRRVARPSVLVSSPITRLWVPRPCVLCKGGTRSRRYDMGSFRCVNISTPTLRKVREGWGTHRAGCAKIKTWATRRGF